MNPLTKYPWLSNYYQCSIQMNNREYCSVDEVYEDHKDSPDPYMNLEAALTFATYIKFQDENLKQKLLDIDENILYDIRSKKLRERLLMIKEVIEEIGN